MNLLPLILKVLLSIGYLILGAFILLYKPLPAPLLNLIFGVAVLIYGTFRAYRAWVQYRSDESEQ